MLLQRWQALRDVLSRRLDLPLDLRGHTGLGCLYGRLLVILPRRLLHAKVTSLRRGHRGSVNLGPWCLSLRRLVSIDLRLRDLCLRRVLAPYLFSLRQLLLLQSLLLQLLLLLLLLPYVLLSPDALLLLHLFLLPQPVSLPLAFFYLSHLVFSSLPNLFFLLLLPSIPCLFLMLLLEEVCLFLLFLLVEELLSALLVKSLLLEGIASLLLVLLFEQVSLFLLLLLQALLNRRWLCSWFWWNLRWCHRERGYRGSQFA